MSVRKASKIFKFSKSCIAFQAKLNKGKHPDSVDIRRKTSPKKVFSLEEEISLFEYLERAAFLQAGLTQKDIRSLAYDFAAARDKTMPPIWKTTKMAGQKWLSGYQKRFTSLSLRKPEVARNTDDTKNKQS